MLLYALKYISDFSLTTYVSKPIAAFYFRNRLIILIAMVFSSRSFCSLNQWLQKRRFDCTLNLWVQSNQRGSSWKRALPA